MPRCYKRAECLNFLISYYGGDKVQGGLSIRSMGQSEAIPPMFREVLKRLRELLFLRVILTICDLQERAWGSLYHSLPHHHWYLEVIYNLIGELHGFRKVVEYSHSFLRRVLGVHFIDQF